MNDQEQQEVLTGIALLIDAAAQDNEEAKKKLMLLAAIGYQVIMQLQQSRGAQMAKCGAKLKRKEDGGVVEDKCGAKMKKKEIGGAMKPCNCKKRLARLGGKLVNVDCNGNIIK